MTLYAGGRAEPHFLIVPGLNDSGPTHWQSRWLDLLRNSSKAELGNWSSPTRHAWTTRLDDAVGAIEAPVILVAHSLGCHAVAHWAADSTMRHCNKVFGALLVAPPDCDHDGAHARLREFGPSARNRLPFPAILAASRNDHYATLDHARCLARTWRTDFVDAGELGHINAASGLGIWPAGLALLGRLVALAGFGRRARIDRPAVTMTHDAEQLRAAA